MTSTEPVEWLFTGYTGSVRISNLYDLNFHNVRDDFLTKTCINVQPSRTPLVQLDRHAPEFFDSSTYCYTSKLLLNLKHRERNNDTGRYIARNKNQHHIFSSFYLFVPSKFLKNCNECSCVIFFKVFHGFQLGIRSTISAFDQKRN